MVSTIVFSPDGLQDIVGNTVYGVRSGCALCEFGLVLESMYDHDHLFGGELQGKWEHSWCKSGLLENGEYWFTFSDRWLRLVEEHVAKRLIHIPADDEIYDVKCCQGYVAFGCHSELLVLDTSPV